MNPATAGGPRRKEELRVEQKQQTSFRMYMVMLAFFAGFAAVTAQLFIIQVRDRAKARDIVRNQSESKEIIPPRRGLIYDRNRSILASNIDELTIAADPTTLVKKDSFALAMARLFGGGKEYYLERLQDESRQYVVLETHVPKELEARFTNPQTPGVIVRSVPRRKVNFQSLASQVIGYTNNDNRGMTGIELRFNEELAGKEGYTVYQKDAKGHRRPELEYPKKAPVNGKSIVLTLDQTFQAIAEEELAAGAEKCGARGGCCIIMQPRTGEIQAMANYPSFTLQDRQRYDSTSERNRAITDLYDPGSTFKIVTASAALNEHAMTVDDKIYAENGSYEWSAGNFITDTHPYGTLTFREAIEHSSNICMAKVARKIGSEKLFTYARKFGFGIPTGVELPGEQVGALAKPVDWNPSEQLHIAFGYNISVNALQIASAYAAIANDGILMQPYIKKWLLDENGNVVEENVPRTVRRVVSAETAQLMKDCFEGVVQRGTARLARIDGMRIAGKTGTSRKLLKGGYSQQYYLSSFVGFFPVEDPKILIFVLMDSPDITHGYTGGSVAAPVFREIALRLINTSEDFSRKPDPLPSEIGIPGMVRVPRICGLRADIARRLLAARGLSWKQIGAGDIVATQSPSPDSTVREGSGVTVMLRSFTDGEREGRVTVPDLTGMTMRQALALLRALKLKTDAAGSGVVQFQYPNPGERVPPRTLCRISCAPRGVLAARLY